MAILRVRVHPGASRNRVEGYGDGILRLRVTARPEAGRANVAVIEMLAQLLGVPRSRLNIVRGATSRSKVIGVSGMDDHALEEQLQGIRQRGRD